MIERLRQAAPLLYPGAAAAAAAFGGARFSADLRLSAAIWAAAALGVLQLAIFWALNTRLNRSRHMREMDADRHALSMGRRARSIMLDVIARDGSWESMPLDQVLTDVTPEGRLRRWEQPYGVMLIYQPMTGGTDGETA